MLYVLICKDLPDVGLERRMKARPDHLAYLASLGDKVRVGGAILSPDGAKPQGSMLVVEAASLEEAQDIAENDPYAKAGVFESVEIHPWRQAAGVVGVASSEGT